MTPESFVEYFRTRHSWKCRPGSAIHKDLVSFAADQAESPHDIEDLYVLFCVAHGMMPKRAPSGTATSSCGNNVDESQ